MNNIHNVVYNFKTKHKEGFTKSEIEELLTNYPDITIEKLFEKIGVHTAMTINNDDITFHRDIEIGIRCCLDNRDVSISEWD
jgi:hypothetical protein